MNALAGAPATLHYLVVLLLPLRAAYGPPDQQVLDGPHGPCCRADLSPVRAICPCVLAVVGFSGQSGDPFVRFYVARASRMCVFTLS